MVKERSSMKVDEHNLQKFNFADYCNNIHRKVLAASTNGSVNTSIFKDFLDKLKHFIQEHEETTLDKWIIIMDNAATHRSKKIHEYFKENNMRVAYIPLYMPELPQLKDYFQY